MKQYELEIQDRTTRCSYGLFVSSTVSDYFEQQLEIAQKFFKSEIEACPAYAGLCTTFKLQNSFATFFAANVGRLLSFDGRNGW